MLPVPLQQHWKLPSNVMLDDYAAPLKITSIEPPDVNAGFSCGNRALDDYFTRHAVPNHAAGISRAYVLRGEDPTSPSILGWVRLHCGELRHGKFS